MSITEITIPSAVPAAVADYEAQNKLIQSALVGLSKITLSEYDTDLAPAVKVGSNFNVGGSTYSVSTADETPSGYSGIANSTTFYLYFDSSATAFIYDATAPVWNDAYQGWYNGTDRAFFSMYKDAGGTLYQSKNKLVSNNESIGGLQSVDVISYIHLNQTLDDIDFNNDYHGFFSLYNNDSSPNTIAIKLPANGVYNVIYDVYKADSLKGNLYFVENGKHSNLAGGSTIYTVSAPSSDEYHVTIYAKRVL